MGSFEVQCGTIPKFEVCSSDLVFNNEPRADYGSPLALPKWALKLMRLGLKKPALAGPRPIIENHPDSIHINPRAIPRLAPWYVVSQPGFSCERLQGRNIRKLRTYEPRKELGRLRSRCCVGALRARRCSKSGSLEQVSEKIMHYVINTGV